MPASREQDCVASGVRIEARSDGTCELLLYGDVGPEIAAKEIAEQIASASGPITVRINSYGGDLADGIAIYNALRRHADVTVVVDGVAASAASVIAMAGARIEMAENATLMIHGPRTISMGDSGAMRDAADSLDRMAEAMARIYASRPRVSYEQALEWLRDGSDHWFSASEALAIGLVDAVVEASREAARFLQPVKEWLEMVKKKASDASQAAEPVESSAATALPEAETPEKHSAEDHSMKKVERPRIEAGAGERPANVVEVDFLRRRNEEIETIARPFAHRDGVARLEREYLRDPTRSVEDFRRDLLAELARGQEPIATAPAFDAPPAAGAPAQVVVDEAEKLRRGVRAWLAVKAGVVDLVRAAGVDEREIEPGEFRGLTLVEVAKNLLERAGIQTRGMGKREAVNAALRTKRIFAAVTQSTSDFAVLLEDVMHKTLLGAYREQEITWPRWARRGTVSDFRTHTRYRPGSFGRLTKLLENETIPYAAVPDGEKATVSVDEHGVRVALPRKAIVNDDLGVFSGIAADLGRAARLDEEYDLVQLLLSNPTMSDGVGLFDANHGNLGTASAPSVASFDDARILMRRQKDVSGNRYIRLTPTVWLGPPSIAGTARVVNEAEFDVDKGDASTPNRSRGMVRDLVDVPDLPDSPAAWYVFANPDTSPALEIAFLEGEAEPRVEQKDAWETTGLEWRVVHTYGVAALDWRAVVKNPGV